MVATLHKPCLNLAPTITRTPTMPPEFQFCAPTIPQPCSNHAPVDHQIAQTWYWRSKPHIVENNSLSMFGL